MSIPNKFIPSSFIQAKKFLLIFQSAMLLIFCSILSFAFAQDIRSKAANNMNTNEDLLAQFLISKGNDTIVFDASNIKRFWIENSVVSRKDCFEILLNRNGQSFKSPALKIQLANVKENQNCRIEVIAETPDFDFVVMDRKQKVISSSKNENDFIVYSVASSTFPLEMTQDFSFGVMFNSKNKDTLSLKSIILSFSENKASSYLYPPGKHLFVDKDFVTSSSSIVDTGSNSFSVTGKRSFLNASKKIRISDNTLSSSVTIKNIGENATNIYVGYSVYTKDHIKLDKRHFPYKKGMKTMTVISSSKGSEKIIVDSYVEWDKNCYLALNAKDDFSDIPNNTFTDGKIIEFKKLENGNAEITLDKPLTSKIMEGTKIRVHGQGGSNLYTGIKTLQPGEEQVFTAARKKDNDVLEFSSNILPRGTYYATPMVLSYSVDPNKDNTILIKDYVISY